MVLVLVLLTGPVVGVVVDSGGSVDEDSVGSVVGPLPVPVFGGPSASFTGGTADVPTAVVGVGSVGAVDSAGLALSVVTVSEDCPPVVVLVTDSVAER